MDQKVSEHTEVPCFKTLLTGHFQSNRLQCRDIKTTTARLNQSRSIFDKQTCTNIGHSLPKD